MIRVDTAADTHFCESLSFISNEKSSEDIFGDSSKKSMKKRTEKKECDLCNKTLISSTSLERHRKNVHGEIIQGRVHSELPTRDLGDRFKSHQRKRAPIHSRSSSTYTHALTVHKCQDFCFIRIINNRVLGHAVVL